MRLLHLSDIHFQEPDCLEPATDPERPYRTRLKSDLVKLCVDKAVDAILVSGDIAFKGHPKEFTVADHWLKEMATASGCRPDRIFVVPGNHDVDRAICKQSMGVANAQQAIADAPPLRREEVFRAQLKDVDSGPALFKPLTAYNAFASPLGCFVGPGKPFWTYDLGELGGGVMLRLHGLTSTLISGLGGRDDTAGKLYLSPLQTVLDPEPDVLNLVMAHHPPRWLLDEHAVDDVVNSRAPLQFFGHEHRQRCTMTPDYTRFAAGSVNPARAERDWKPGYNIIDLQVLHAGSDRVVQVRAQVRQLQQAPERFIPLTTSDGQDVWVHNIRFPGQPARVARPAAAQPASALAANPADSGAPAQVVLPTEVVMSSPSTKGLVYRFWTLPDSQKREIMTRLGVIANSDSTLSDQELYDGALRLAAKRGLLDEVAREVDRLQQQG